MRPGQCQAVAPHDQGDKQIPVSYERSEEKKKSEPIMEAIKPERERWGEAGVHRWGEGTGVLD